MSEGKPVSSWRLVCLLFTALSPRTPSAFAHSIAPCHFLLQTLCNHTIVREVFTSSGFTALWHLATTTECWLVQRRTIASTYRYSKSPWLVTFSEAYQCDTSESVVLHSHGSEESPNANIWFKSDIIFEGDDDKVYWWWLQPESFFVEKAEGGKRKLAAWALKRTRLL